MSKRDPKTGRFVTTTNSSRYKKVQFNNKVMQEHQRVYCIILDIPEIPKGIVVHHLDGNKKNNDKDNLALMTITAHNRVHSSDKKRKGIKLEIGPYDVERIEKAKVGRYKTYIKKCRVSYNMLEKGFSYSEISEVLGITEFTAEKRCKDFIQYKEERND